MTKYIKSYSNYVLKKKHQTINDGTVYERDMTTIGGLNQFAPGQIPKYQSGNFIITVNNDNNSNKSFLKNDEGWEKNGESEVWTLSNIIDSDVDNDEKSLKIVLKQDYYKLSDFAYFGSCVELIRASILDIVTRYPGELYVPSIGQEGVPLYYTTNEKCDGKNCDENGFLIKRMGDEYDGGGWILVDNPHNINIHTSFINESEVENPLKYVCLSYKDYGLENPPSVTEYACINGEEKPLTNEIKENISKYKVSKLGIGSKIADIVVNGFKIGAFVNTDNNIVYLTQGNKDTSLLKPIDSVINNFFDSLDNFQKILMNRDSYPKYTALLEVTKENSFGYISELKSFTFPTTFGKYNLAVADGAYNVYLNDLLKYAEFYDEYFSDNIWRSMTHEAIKNFDWTFTREYGVGEEEGYVFGGTRIQKTLRLIGREFDEIKTYIDGLRNYNRISYGKDNAVPDYFLTDLLNEEGWDVKNIYPYKKEESSNIFKQIIKLDDIKPYSESYSNEVKNNNKRNVKYDAEKGVIPISKQYTSEKIYTIDEINNHFMKVLKLNSKSIFRKKGTIEGIESLLSLFGLKSRRWVEDEKNRYSDYDYDIKEYITATNYIEDEWKDNLCMNEHDWHNRNKTIVYNTIDFKNGIYHSYQGLPVKSYIEHDNKYYQTNSLPLGNDGNPIPTDEKNRFLFPYFSKDMLIDGNPYYQMNGGWLRKEPYTFGIDDIIVSSKTDNGEIVDLYTETYRTLKQVNDLKELVTLPKQLLREGDIYEVKDISNNYALVDGIIYEIKYDENNNPYLPFYIRNNSVTIGSKVFYTQITLSDAYQENKVYSYIFNTYANNTEIRGYILDIDENPTFKAHGQYYAVNKFMLFKDGKYDKNMTNTTNYFMLKNVDNKMEIGGNGWVQLLDDEPFYLRTKTIIDDFKGNNPHTGNMNYDGGKEYISYFEQIFKFALNGNQFNERCYSDAEFFSVMDDLKKYGFNDLTDDSATNYCGYHKYEDEKIHYLGNYYESNKDNNNVTTYEFKDNLKSYDKKMLQTEHPNVKEDLISTDVKEHIMNIKCVDITFYLNEEIEKAHQVKYYDSIIMNYLKEMLPSTLIINVNYCGTK